MEITKTYDKYPLWIVLLSNVVSLFIYGLGFLIILKLGWIFSIAYLVYILAIEIRLIKNHCVKCYYWGKTCGFGKGQLSSWFFKKGDNSTFCLLEISWRTMIPDMLISLLPILTGIIIIIRSFDLVLLVLMLLLVFFTTIGNGFIRGNLTCNYCKQKELGCTAEKLFNNKK